MSFDIGGLVKTVAPLAATAFGGPVAGAAASAIFGGMGGEKAGGAAGGLGGMLGGLLGKGGQDGIGALTSMFAGGNKPAGMGMMPDLAKAALSMFKDATPEQKGKLLDIAIMALGGDPKASAAQKPGGDTALSSPNNAITPPAANDKGTTEAKGTDAGKPAGTAKPTTDAKAPAEKVTIERGADGSTKVTYEKAGDKTADKTGSTSASSTSSTSPSGSSTDGKPMTVEGNKVDTGRYTVEASKEDGGTVKVFDKQTNTFVKAFGDPHVETSDGDKMGFNKNGLSIKLPDGTNVHMKPTEPGKDGKSYIDSAMVEKDGKAVTMDGLHAGKVQTSQPKTVSDDLRSDYMTQGQTVLDASNQDVGDLFMTGADGQRTKEVVNDKGAPELSLDGMGGALNKGGAGKAGEKADAAKGTDFAVNAEHLQKMGQILSLTGKNVTDQGTVQDLIKNLQQALETMMKPADEAA